MQIAKTPPPNAHASPPTPPTPPAGGRPNATHDPAAVAEVRREFVEALADGEVDLKESRQLIDMIRLILNPVGEVKTGKPATDAPKETAPPTPAPRPVEDVAAVEDRPPVGDVDPLVWGEKVSPAFREKVREVAGRLDMDPDHLMAIMAFESGRTFSPNIKNAAGSGATGLIQFMPATARGLGTTTDELANMSAVEQLDYVEAYFEPYKGKLDSVSDAYMAVLWPRGVGKDSDYTLWSQGTVAYRQNAGLDANGDGRVTKGEAAGKVEAMLAEGARFAG